MAIRAGHDYAQGLLDAQAGRKRRTQPRGQAIEAPRGHYVVRLCRSHALPEPELEVRFHEKRRWRFDYCWPKHMVALEREGGVWTRGRHTRGKGFEADAIKYAEAALKGWMVFRASPQQIVNGTVLGWLQRALVTAEPGSKEGHPMTDLEYYPTPSAFTRWLFQVMANRGTPIVGRIFEPCVGDGAILRAADLRAQEFGVRNHWFTNDLDPRWPADVHKDATDETLWQAHEVAWTVTNPPFTPALAILDHALKYSTVGVAMHLRASIHEVLKTGIRRTWMANHPPTGILWLPRFAYQRSKTTGKWTTDSVCACWCVWLKDHRQFIEYAPESVIDALDAETPAYRKRMDLLMAERKAVA